jgi:hypothetical protein
VRLERSVAAAVTDMAERLCMNEVVEFGHFTEVGDAHSEPDPLDTIIDDSVLKAETLLVVFANGRDGFGDGNTNVMVLRALPVMLTAIGLNKAVEVVKADPV